MIKEPFSERLTKTLERRGMTAAALSRRTGLSRSLISHYTNGRCKANSFQLVKLAAALNVSEAWLMGFDVPMTDTDVVKSIERRTVPVLGEIACGVPKLAQQTFDAYVQAGADVACDFCLIARGDSMTGARIYDGDIVFIREQPLVSNGEIAAVIIDDEATLKRVFLSDGKLVLQAENPKYPPLIYIGDELNAVRILGKAVAFQSDVR